MYEKISGISVLSALVASLLPTIFLGPAWVVIALVAFPIIAILAFIGLVVWQRLGIEQHVSRPIQIPIISLLGGIVGGLAYLALFGPNILEYGVRAFSFVLLFQYAGLGTVSAVLAWLGYNFGPLAASPKHSNKSLKSGTPQSGAP